jgi:4a-hydroxytetrahydrobiopterin dehydratase
MDNLAQENCSPINATSTRLSEHETDRLLAELNGWKVYNKDNELRLEKGFKFGDFKQALEFTNQVGGIAEAENHHPALLTEWGRVTVAWWTHKIKGLHRNDFIMAAKTDAQFTKSH